MNKSPLRSVLVSLLVVAFVATACSSDGGDTVAAGDSPSEPDGEDITDADDTLADDLPDGPLGAGPFPIAELTIDYTDGETSTSYGITCLGDTATITGDSRGVIDQRACLALADGEVQQRLFDGPPEGLCTAQFGGDDEATISGRIDDRPVDTSVDLRDGCGISSWRLLGDVLPEPRGVVLPDDTQD